MKIPDAKAAVDKEWKKLETIPAWDVREVQSKEEVKKEAQENHNKVHFASLMDLCYLKNSELEPQFQKYKGRVVLRGDIVKDDAGACAVFTEQGSSASQIDSRKSNGCYWSTTRLWRTSSWRNIGVHPGKNGGCPKTTQNSLIRMSGCMDTSSKTHMAEVMGIHWGSSCSSWTKLLQTPTRRTLVGKTVWKSIDGTW